MARSIARLSRLCSRRDAAWTGSAAVQRAGNGFAGDRPACGQEEARPRDRAGRRARARAAGRNRDRSRRRLPALRARRGSDGRRRGRGGGGAVCSVHVRDRRGSSAPMSRRLDSFARSAWSSAAPALSSFPSLACMGLPGVFLPREPAGSGFPSLPVAGAPSSQAIRSSRGSMQAIAPMRTVPVHAKAKGVESPGFIASMVTVSSALMQGRTARPVWAERPLGTSAAMMKAPAFRARTAASIHASKGAAMEPPENPVPRMASMMTAAFSISESSVAGSGETRMRAPCSSSAASASIAASRAGWARRSCGSFAQTMLTGRPASASMRAATHPSPPLLPLPQSTTTRDASRARRRAPSCPARGSSEGCGQERSFVSFVPVVSLVLLVSVGSFASSRNASILAMARCAIHAPARSMRVESGVPALAIACSSLTTSGTSRRGASDAAAAAASGRYASTSASSPMAAFAGLVEGSCTQAIPVFGSLKRR